MVGCTLLVGGLLIAVGVVVGLASRVTSALGVVPVVVLLRLRETVP